MSEPRGDYGPPVLVRQEHPMGCGVAVLAMVLGKTYGEVHDILMEHRIGSRPLADNQGIYEADMEWLFAREGYAWRRIYEKSYLCPWPPGPFAPIHYANVEQPSRRNHYVVVLADGSVLDPLGSDSATLADWPRTVNITGLWSPAHLGSQGSAKPASDSAPSGSNAQVDQ